MLVAVALAEFGSNGLTLAVESGVIETLLDLVGTAREPALE